MDRKSLMATSMLIFLLMTHAGEAQELRYREEPLSLEKIKKMSQYKEISFSPESLEKVANGMSEEQVISLLGPPKDLKKERRRHGRWTAHYFYPEGYVVHFRNGLVVGKEKTETGGPQE